MYPYNCLCYWYSIGDLNEEGMIKAVQMKLESTILLPSGSNAQRVQVCKGFCDSFVSGMGHTEGLRLQYYLSLSLVCKIIKFI